MVKTLLLVVVLTLALGVTVACGGRNGTRAGHCTNPMSRWRNGRKLTNITSWHLLGVLQAMRLEAPSGSKTPRILEVTLVPRPAIFDKYKEGYN